MSVENNNLSYRILVITSPKAIHDIQKKVKREENISLTLARLSDITALLTRTGTKLLYKGKSIGGYDFVWIQTASHTKDIAYILSLYLDQLKIPHTSPEIEITKIVDLFCLSLNSISIPKTYFCSKKKLLKQLPFISNELGYPFLIKATVGWGGSHIYMINTSEDFFNIVPDLPEHKKYICQKFIPNEFDYRIIVGNGVVLSGEKRIRTNDSYRNNVSLGAQEQFLELNEIPQEVKKLAVKAANICKLSWAGIDIITNKKTGRNYVLEINRHPGLTIRTSETKAAMTFLKDIKKSLQND
jgi:hypothetical protein